MEQNYILKTKDGIPYEVSAQGSLGLLALGYIGLQLWREKRKESSVNPNKSEDSSN